MKHYIHREREADRDVEEKTDGDVEEKTKTTTNNLLLRNYMQVRKALNQVSLEEERNKETKKKV